MDCTLKLFLAFAFHKPQSMSKHLTLFLHAAFSYPFRRSLSLSLSLFCSLAFLTRIASLTFHIYALHTPSCRPLFLFQLVLFNFCAIFTDAILQRKRGNRDNHRESWRKGWGMRKRGFDGAMCVCVCERRKEAA